MYICWNVVCSCCSNNLVQLKEKQVDYKAQHLIAADLFHEIRTKGRFILRVQCILDAVQLVALTISNLQRLEVVLSQTEGISKDDVEQFHRTVNDHVCHLLNEVKAWLPNVLPIWFGTRDACPMELAVSMILLLCYVLSLHFCFVTILADLVKLYFFIVQPGHCHRLLFNWLNVMVNVTLA